MSAQGRFILVDHSLCDYAGHHYEYARAVLDAAVAGGRQAVLATNRKFAADVASDWPIVPTFKYGVWLHQGAPAWQIALWRAWKAVRRGVECRFSLRETAPFRGAKSDTGLGEDSERGFARASFKAARRRRFVRDTANLLDRLAVTGDDLIFAPTLSLAELESLGELGRTAHRACRPVWHLLFRRPLESRRSACNPFAPSPGGNSAGDGRSVRVHYWTDSEELTAEYRRATGWPFGTLPIPHTAPYCKAAGKPPPLRILYLGDARLEKGFQHLPALVRSLTQDDPDRRRFEFYIQSHSTSPAEEPQISSARAELARLANRGVTLFDAPLAPAQYRELLASGHVVVLPYDPRAYAARSSGVFAEALAAGIPLVVPADTWMSRQLPAGAGEAFEDIEEVAALVRNIAADYRNYANGARSGAEDWRRRHNAERLVSLLLGAARRAELPDNCEPAALVAGRAA